MFLNPNDAAISKYTRLTSRDRSWIRAGLKAGFISMPALELSIYYTSFLDDKEKDKVKKAIAEDKKWLQKLNYSSKLKL